MGEAARRASGVPFIGMARRRNREADLEVEPVRGRGAENRRCSRACLSEEDDRRTPRTGTEGMDFFCF